MLLLSRDSEGAAAGIPDCFPLPPVSPSRLLLPRATLCAHDLAVSGGLGGPRLVIPQPTPMSQALPSLLCYDNFLPCYYKC